jgi:hypothetical protein
MKALPLKNKSPFYLIVFALLLSAGCDRSANDFEIVNDSDFEIDSLSIVPTGEKKETFISLAVREKDAYSIDEDDASEVLVMSYKINNHWKDKTFRHWKAASELSEPLMNFITIKNDSVVLELDRPLNYKNSDTER